MLILTPPATQTSICFSRHMKKHNIKEYYSAIVKNSFKIINKSFNFSNIRIKLSTHEHLRIFILYMYALYYRFKISLWILQPQYT